LVIRSPAGMAFRPRGAWGFERFVGMPSPGTRRACLIATMLALADVSPMLLADRRPPVPVGGWLYELKHDGYRVLASVSGDAVQLRTRNGADCTRWYPEVVAGLATLAGDHILDGEACVLDDVGRPDFERLQIRSRRRRWYEGADHVAFLAFDLLVHAGRDIRGVPVQWRKKALQKLLTPAPPAVLYVGHVEEGGDQLYAQACALQLEGIVCKRLGSVYAGGERNGDWLKVKRPGAIPPERFQR
jgi:bifunctional non-homologous end joining protein LigD